LLRHVIDVRVTSTQDRTHDAQNAWRKAAYKATRRASIAGGGGARERECVGRGGAGNRTWGDVVRGVCHRSFLECTQPCISDHASLSIFEMVVPGGAQWWILRR
jgi:hypothetical protein